MRSAVLSSPRRLEVQEIPRWSLDEYEDSDLVLLQVAACGVCGSDFRYFQGENPWAQHVLGRFVENPPNIVLGHEYAGTVVEVKSRQNERLLGKRVAPICSKVCGECEDCQCGRSHLCERTVHMGHGQGWGLRTFYPGAYARYALAWGASCQVIPAGLTFPEAAMMDILAVAVHAARQGSVKEGSRVLCFGAGPAGNSIAQAARAMGASECVLLDVSPVALEMVRKQGIGTAMDVTGKSASALKQMLEPYRFDAVFDTVGSETSFSVGLGALAKRGAYVALAVHEAAFPINLLTLGGERRIVTSCNFEERDFEDALRWLVEGKLLVKEWLQTVSLDELPALFEAAISAKAKPFFKLVVDPTR